MTSAMPPWPTARSTRTAFEDRFGSENADFMQMAMNTGDPLADAVVEAIRENGEVRGQINDGAKNGLASLSDPHPAVVALLTQCEAVPDFHPFLTPEEFQTVLRNGNRSWYIFPPVVTDIGLASGSLTQLYTSLPLSTVLNGTGRLIEGAGRRLIETSHWLNIAQYPGNLLPGNVGYVETIQVRMIHAYVRAAHLKRGYDTAALGTPISQSEMAFSWYSFTLTCMVAAEEMGYSLTPAETAEFYTYWWYIGHLLGIDPRYFVGVTNHKQAMDGVLMEEMVKGEIASDGGALAKSMNVAIAMGAAEDFVAAQIDADPVEVIESLSHRFHGYQTANALGVPFHHETYMKLGRYISSVRGEQAKLRNNPEEWKLAISAGMKSSVGRLLGPGTGGQTSYQAAAAGTLDSHVI